MTEGATGDPPMERRAAIARAAPYALAGAGLLAAFIAVYVIAVLTETGQRVENTALLGAAIRSEAERGRSADALSPVSLATFGLAVFLVVTAGFARRRSGLGLVAGAVMVVAVVAAELLKDVLPRPAHIDGPVWLLRNSFPSGTVAVVAATGVGALLVSPDRLRWAVLVVGGVALAIAAQSTQIAGWHRLSDAVGSGLLVAAVGAFGVSVLAAGDLVADSSVGRITWRVYAGILSVGGVLLALGTLLLVLLVVFPLLSSPEGGRRVFFQTAFPLFAAALTPLTLVLFARLLEGRSLGRRPAEERDELSEATGSSTVV
ncbi:MAG TPA: phosphatase PAP2 family protein [Candidatus Limnocylindrales bacterium]|nr:phosphatase PAP2 family protein [Candidatus Limnocylindrales bacterium]